MKRAEFLERLMQALAFMTAEERRSVREYYEELLGKRITRDAKLGTPMSWDLVDFSE